MKKHFFIVSLAVLLCFAFGCQKDEGEAAEEAMEMEGLTEAQAMVIEDALKANYTEYLDAMIEMNLDGSMAYYSETDFQEMLMGVSTYTDREALRNVFVEMIEGRASQGWENLGIKVSVLSGDAAYVSASYDYTINHEDGRIYQGKAVQTMIWQMEAAGWKITHDHVSWAGQYLEE